MDEVYMTIDPAYTERDFALYEAIIVKHNKTVSATARIDKKDLDNDKRQTWAQHGLMPKKS